jgi:glutaconate CoA-transferase subunit B
VTTVFTDIHLYVPRHSRAVFVERLDFASSLGHSPDRRHGRGPQYLVSDLGQFDFADGRLRLTHVHPGVSPDEVDRRTGFRLDRAAVIETTPPPSKHEMELLRTVVDPLDVRRLEFLSGSQRRAAMEEILQTEEAMFARQAANGAVY